VTKENSIAKLAEVKLALARKCDRLMKTTTSVPRRKTLVQQAAKFRRQAADLTRK
jgi:hypothetical protein